MNMRIFAMLIGAFQFVALQPSVLAEKAKPPSTIRIGLAQLKRPETVAAGTEKITRVLAECGKKGVKIECFPETYLPGLRGEDTNLPPVNQEAMERAVDIIRASCSKNRVAAIVGLEWKSPLGLEDRALVISAEGQILGYQTKNQITPGGEEKNYVPDGRRQVFEINEVTIGVVICHEGWRYPETVRWAAVRGAQIIFQPQVTGSDRPGEAPLRKWGESFYEKAMQCRAAENTVYFASVNRAMTHQNSATSLIDPAGNLLQYLPCMEENLLVADLDLTKATRRYARRYKPDLYQENTAKQGRQIKGVR